MNLLGYAKTRFLALGPAIKRVLKLFDALQSYFIDLPKGEKVLKKFFQTPESKFWLLFVQDQAEIFSQTILKIEGDNITAIEVLKYINELKNTLEMREEDQFLSRASTEEKEKLMEFSYEPDTNQISAMCTDFFGNLYSFCNIILHFANDLYSHDIFFS